MVSMQGTASSGDLSSADKGSRAVQAANKREGFFTHHGIWAPGVRLFRRLGFQSKSAIVSVAFLVPMLLLGWYFDVSKRADISFVRAERDGIAYALPLVRLSAQISHEQASASAQNEQAWAKAREARQQVWSELKAVHDDRGNGLQAQAAFKALSAGVDGMPAAGGTQAGAEHYQLVLQAQSALLDVVIDKSNLALDPAFASYYLMDAMLIGAPELIQSAGRLRSLMLSAIRAGKLGMPELLLMDRERGAVERRVQQLGTSLGKVATEMPELVASLPTARVQTSAASLLALADAMVQGKAMPVDNREAITLANETLDASEALALKGMPMLDAILAERGADLSLTRFWVSGVTFACLMLALYLLFCFYQVTRGGMEEVRLHLVAMTRGDLTTHPRPWGCDEAASLMLSLAEMQQAMRTVVGGVRRAAEVIVQSSAQIAEGSNDLSNRTEHTASNLEESASSMEEIAATVRHTADNAGEASSLAQGNAEVAKQGGSVIEQVVQTMQNIHQSSNQIADIIRVIDSIAFQTNILALNAAVEAARAGEQGRGFAVVAGEVRALAQRSAHAAHEIKELITTSVNNVQSGAQVVQAAGQTMADIVANAQRMNDLLLDIATGAREQSSGVELVGQSVHELDRVTQENAALVEETAAACEALKMQSLSLMEAVSAFKLP